MTFESNEHTQKTKVAEVTIYDWSSKSFKLQSKFYSARVILLCPYAVYMYKIMILLTFSSEIRLPISTKFCVDSTVDWESVQMVTLLTVMFMYGKIMITKKTKKTHSSSSKPRTAQMMTLSLVAMTGFEKCCITSAYLQCAAVAISLRWASHGPWALCFFSFSEAGFFCEY